jgi:hypothetical protein
VVKISTEVTGNNIIRFPIVQTAVKDPMSFVSSTVHIIFHILWLEMSENNVIPWLQQLCFELYKAPGIFQTTYESKESFGPIGVFRS